MPLSAFLIDELKPHVEGRDPDELLFTGPQGGALRASNFVRRVFDPAVQAAGLGNLRVTPHKLRHTAASLAIASGADVNVVQTMLGHKSATMTLDVYGHLFPDRLDEVSKKMHKRRARVLAKARAKAERTKQKAQEAAADLSTLEQAAA
ncbi:tyrosine-type recombinase/integrase [Streptomyces sp. CA-111067]|uniref:tyrosine-type recombinase/integrase n=1 Tax=Streptomyces sp. CA-111067 TaxID=3240046 RepID=UPI003D98D0EB